MREFQIGELVRAIQAPNRFFQKREYDNLLRTNWFPKYKDDIMTIRSIHRTNEYTNYIVEENNCIWCQQWLEPVPKEDFLDEDLFEL